MPKLTIEYEEFQNLTDLSLDEQHLVQSAWSARKNAYSPYSKFQVGAAVLTTRNQVFIGSNQEVANYKVSCAERAAINSASTHGHIKQITKIAIVGGPAEIELNETPSTPEIPTAPCGQCRQDIKEVEDLIETPITIILASRNLIRRFIGIQNLLPFAFGPADLK